MDDLSLEIGEHSWADGPVEPAVITRINGRRLGDLILASAREHLPGDTWEGDVHPPGLWQDLLVRWSDVPEDQDAGRWTPVLVCGCGDFPCGGLAARMTANGGVIVWHDFIDADSYAVGFWEGTQDWQVRRALQDIGPFHFSETHYRQEIGNVLAACEADLG